MQSSVAIAFKEILLFSTTYNKFRRVSKFFKRSVPNSLPHTFPAHNSSSPLAKFHSLTLACVCISLVLTLIWSIRWGVVLLASEAPDMPWGAAFSAVWGPSDSHLKKAALLFLWKKVSQARFRIPANPCSTYANNGYQKPSRQRSILNGEEE